MTDEPRDPPETPPKPPSNVIPFNRRRVRRKTNSKSCPCKSKETAMEVDANVLVNAARLEMLLTVGELARRVRHGGVVKGWLAGRLLRPVAEAFDYVFRDE